MDRHEWKHKGMMQCYVADEGSRVALAVPYTDPVNRENAAAAEILRLAEESEARRVYIEDFEKQAVATGEENQRLRAELTKEEDERDALKLTAEEGQEIIGELSMALAILAGESLVSCGEDICGDDVKTCRGHLGQRAREVVRHSLATYRALLEGNRLAAERIVELEQRLAASAEHAALHTGFLAALLTEIQKHHEPLEGAIDTLRRIIRQRDAAISDKNEWKRSALGHRAKLRKCMELADKAGKIRELVERLAALAGEDEGEERTCSAYIPPADLLKLQKLTSAVIREALYGKKEEPAAKLLALLDSEEPPEALFEELRRRRELSGEPVYAVSPQALWRWLREQVAHVPPVAPEG